MAYRAHQIGDQLVVLAAGPDPEVVDDPTDLIFWSNRAPCPRCGSSVGGLGRKDRGWLSQCAKCRHVVRSDQATITLLPREYAADKPVFAVMLKERVKLPELCAACGAPATQRIAVHYRMGAGARALITLAGLMSGEIAFADEKLTLEVPHCADHDDGAVIKDKDKAHLVLYSRSYAFAWDFARLNRRELTYQA